MSTKPRLGYVGVGLMGLPMVKHLLPRGYSIKAYDIVPAHKVAEIVKQAQKVREELEKEKAKK